MALMCLGQKTKMTQPNFGATGGEPFPVSQAYKIQVCSEKIFKIRPFFNKKYINMNAQK